MKRTVFDIIQELEAVNMLSKHEQLVNGIIHSINENVLIKGSQLPSVNHMVEELGFARKTISKAYNDLKDRGIIESKSRLGYFVANDNTSQEAKVALLIYAFHPFQEVFYNAFREQLGENIHLDVFFHHNNINMFETILSNIKGQYGMYVVAPIPHPKTREILSTYPDSQLLIVDRYEWISEYYSHVTQEFEITTYMVLKELTDTIKEYDELQLIYKPNSDYPIEVLRAFKKYIEDFGIKGKVIPKYAENSVKKGIVYFTIGDGDLWAILKDCKKKNLTIGEEVGILSNNDGPVKEIICGGITTFSTDFKKMGERAADFVLNRKQMKEVIPTILNRRNSL